MTDAQTEARAIQRYIAPSAGRGAVVQLLKHCDGEWVRYEDHATALAAKDAARDEAIFLKDCAEAALVKRESELVAKNAELAAAKAQLIAAWNAFGPSSSRTGKTAFDADDLEHLPRSADGGLDEQIRCLEDRAERAEAQLAEANKALEEIADAKTELTNRHDYSRGWNDALFRVRQIARRAREQGGENNG